jgi:hypothetical protein
MPMPLVAHSQPASATGDMQRKQATVSQNHSIQHAAAACAGCWSNSRRLQLGHWASNACRVVAWAPLVATQQHTYAGTEARGEAQLHGTPRMCRGPLGPKHTAGLPHSDTSVTRNCSVALAKQPTQGSQHLPWVINQTSNNSLSSVNRGTYLATVTPELRHAKHRHMCHQLVGKPANSQLRASTPY